jgi:ribosome-binding factor A
MGVQRVDRLNSLLKEVIAEVIYNDVRNPKVSKFTTVSQVEITKDLRHAKVHISIIGDEKEKINTLKALNTASGFIAIQASKKIVIRHFPALRFVIDNTVEEQIHIQKLLDNIQEEKEQRKTESQT